MRGKRWCILAVGAALALATTASAEEVIYFANGTYMKIFSHEIQGDMVKVRLDGSGSIAFPSRMVDKIENASGIVYGGPANPVYANQIVARPPGTEAPPSSTPVVGVRSAEARAEDPDTIAAARRATTYRATTMKPMSGRQAENEYIDGSIAATRGPGPSGSVRLGNHYVIGSGSRLSSPFKPMRLAVKPGIVPEESSPADGTSPPEANPVLDPGAPSEGAPPNQ